MAAFIFGEIELGHISWARSIRNVVGIKTMLLGQVLDRVEASVKT